MYGVYAAANKREWFFEHLMGNWHFFCPVCADTVDCYSGQICQAGRCVFQSGYGGYAGLGALTGYGLGGGYSGYGYGLGTDPTALATAGLYSPYGMSSLACESDSVFAFE